MARPLYEDYVRSNTLEAQTSNAKRKYLCESTYKESGNLGDFASDIFCEDSVVEPADSPKVR